MSNANSSSVEPSDDVAAKAVSKRYEGLVAVRTKAVKGKGAWYWAHFEPILIRNPDTNIPKSVKLKCTLCNAAFSASNPSRTASEHLKRGTCPNFGLMQLKPISQLPPLSTPSPSTQQKSRKRSLPSQLGVGSSTSTSSNINNNDSNDDVYPISFSVKDGILPFQSSQEAVPPPVLSGGKDDLGPLAMLENSVKKLKSPKAPAVPSLRKDQVFTAFDLLADWLYESCGSVSFSCLEHPQFKAFLNHLGLPELCKKEFLNDKLDSKFGEARMESEARIRDAAFFQVSSDGWNRDGFGNADRCLVKFMVNLPNGTRVFQRGVYSNGGVVPSQYVEEVLWETVRGVCGNNPHRCVGIVADKYKAKALRNLELQNTWMVNLPCLLQGFFSLIKDLYRELPVFRTVTENCIRIANLINSTPQIRNSFRKFRFQGLELAGFIRVPRPKCDVSKNLGPFIAMLEDLLNCSQVLHLVVSDDSYKIVCSTDVSAREVVNVIQDVSFWNDVEASHSLVKMITKMAEEIESERPLIGQCLPLWEDLRAKVKDWCSKYSIPEGPVEQVIERRFKKNYHPAWSAAFILDPLYLIRDASGKYLPPFKCLTHEQENDIDKLVTRLVSRDEAHVALMELMKWRSEGLDPLYAQAVQVKQRDPTTGKMRIANPQSSRLVWETCLKEFKSLSKVAVRLLFLHATSCSVKSDWSFARLFCGQEGQSRLGIDQAQKMLFIAAHAKLERRDLASEKDAELYGGEDDMLNEVLAETSSI